MMAIPGLRIGAARGRNVMFKRRQRSRISRSPLRMLASGLSQHEQSLLGKRLARMQPPVATTVGFSPAGVASSYSIWVDRLDLARAQDRMANCRVSAERKIHFVPGTRVLLLSRPTKMPGPSWSLPAVRACPFMVSGPNSICGVCYATKGRYSAAATIAAQSARFDWVRRCLRTVDGTTEFVECMTEALVDMGYRYVRVHDSGDLFSPAYTQAWKRICAGLPGLRFWFPTRSWRAPWVQDIRELAALPNVTIRPSALFFDDRPPVVAGLAAGTSASETGFSCPAVYQDNSCRNCRTCWDKPEVAVSYHKH